MEIALDTLEKLEGYGAVKEWFKEVDKLKNEREKRDAIVELAKRVKKLLSAFNPTRPSNYEIEKRREWWLKELEKWEKLEELRDRVEKTK